MHKTKTSLLPAVLNCSAFLIFLVCLTACGQAQAAQESAKAAEAVKITTGAVDKWFGYERHNFKLDGAACYVAVPKKAAAGRPWVWRARFPKFHREIDIELLKAGYHIGYMDVSNLYGSPKAVERWDKFYEFITEKYSLSAKAVLEGVSRGGLIIYNWAYKNPDKTACIYADTPVCDFKSWPGGKGTGRGAKADWQRLLKVDGFASEQEAMEYKHNPIDNLEPLAKRKIPILHVVSISDVVVPPAENTFILQKRYQKLGGDMTVISISTGTRQSFGHHFPLTKELVDFAVNFIKQHSLVKTSVKK